MATFGKPILDTAKMARAQQLRRTIEKRAVTGASCPDCQATALVESTYDSDQIDDGVTIYCKMCGFEIAGRTAGIVRDAMAVLVRWKGRP